MRKLITGSTTALMLGAATIATTVIPTAPADAQRWRGDGFRGGGFNRGWNRGGWNRGYYGRGYGWNRGYYRGRDRTGVAIGAGLLGLGLGAAIASSNRDRYYDRGYYGGGYYDRGYYGGGWGRDCYTRRVWDPYLGRRVRVRYCD
ncbi:hypothetical protein ABC347_03185 [Sphingomonas sp. 1P06PA]|uniref:hypothetical protein n=1 Tax=Sphingomonas sp. 1P06PA TaxID=554121 RepID=UPI0039A6C0EA